ncbi:MAG: type Z 30S ribosomal protein S14 [Rectinema sp.]|jgi:small subunit ribosomal protein S14|nr:type Z 30S ribosomal protein S14 [Spirochaetaceae bacterium]
MARKAMILKALKTPKYTTRLVRRCKICGRSRGYMRKFDMCRICFRKLASEGKLPGVTKSSW